MQLLLHDVRLEAHPVPQGGPGGRAHPRPAACYRPLWRRFWGEGAGMVVTLEC
jgi:hypothetical protein